MGALGCKEPFLEQDQQPVIQQVKHIGLPPVFPSLHTPDTHMVQQSQQLQTDTVILGVLAVRCSSSILLLSSVCLL